MNLGKWMLRFLIGVLCWLIFDLTFVIIAMAKPIEYTEFTVTAYCSCKKCCGKYSPEVTGKISLTKSGTIPIEGRTIAVDPKYIPLGTKVIIDGVTYIAEDTGSNVKGLHIDIFMNDHKKAKNFGKQKRMVYIDE